MTTPIEVALADRGPVPLRKLRPTSGAARPIAEHLQISPLEPIDVVNLRDATKELWDRALVATSPPDIRGQVRIAIRSGATTTQIRQTVARANARLGADPDLFDESHAEEVERILRPRPVDGISDYATLCAALRAQIDDRDLTAPDALEFAATVAQRGCIDYQTGAAIAVGAVIGPQPADRAALTELRIELALEMFATGWDQ